MKQYREMYDVVKTKGVRSANRTGVDTIKVFGHQARFNMADGFPLLTTKKVFTRGIFEELFWFLRGDTNIQYLLDRNVHIWDEWADENGDLGPVYGAMWRSWPTSSGETIDQLDNVIKRLKTHPDCRRAIVSAWNPEVLPSESVPSENPALGKQALAPCHTMFQFMSHENEDGRRVLDLQLYQR